MAAAAAGIPFTLSTMSNRSIEEVAAAAPDGVRWFQLYVQRDRGFTRRLCERAAAAGYSAIVLTVDLPAARDPRARPAQRVHARRPARQLPAAHDPEGPTSPDHDRPDRGARVR